MASSASLLFLLTASFLLSSASSLQVSKLAAAGDTPLQSPPSDHQPMAATTALLVPILSNLGFEELAMAVPTLSSPILNSPWSAPFTLFAAADDSVRSCGGGASACSPARLLKEHLAPGLFSHLYLSKLSFGTKLETAAPNRCLTVTSTAAGSSNSTLKIFVDGVEITRPDLFNDGKIVIHGIQGFIAPLSPFSCISERSYHEIAGGSGAGIVSLMLRDVIIRLRTGGYSILALAMKIKSPELSGLHNMTVFALDDRSIFGGGHAYVTEVRFHVVPNQMLMLSDLMRLPEGSALPTLVRGQTLVVTQRGVPGPFGSGVRINYVPIKAAEVVYNSKIVVHGLFFPFPHVYLADTAYAEAEAEAQDQGGLGSSKAACGAAGGASSGDCKMAPSVAPAASASFEF